MEELDDFDDLGQGSTWECLFWLAFLMFFMSLGGCFDWIGQF